MNFKTVAGMLSRLFFAYSGISCIPLLVAIFIEKNSIIPFSGNVIFAFMLALILFFYGKDNYGHLNVKDALFTMSIGWISVCILGAIPYIIGMPKLDFVTCVFESTSMWTTTGVSTFFSYSELSLSFLVWRTIGHWVGAIGIIMLFMLIIPKMSSGSDVLMTADMSGRGLERTLPKTKESAFVVIAIFLGLNLIAVFLLVFGGMNIWEAINMAMATASTGGISYFKSGVIVFDNVYYQIICLMFMFLSAMNFTLWFKILRFDWRGVWEDAEHRYYCLWIIVATILLAFSLWEANYYDIDKSLKYGFMMAVSYISTTGFAFDHINNWPALSHLIFILLMFTGGCSASTAGGLKIIRCTIIVKAFWFELKKIFHPEMIYTVRYGGRPISQDKIDIIMKFFFLYFFVFSILTLFAAWGNMGIKESITMVAACMSSVGCSLGSISQESSYATVGILPRFIAIIAMILGRMEFLTMLAVLHPDFWKDK